MCVCAERIYKLVKLVKNVSVAQGKAREIAQRFAIICICVYDEMIEMIWIVRNVVANF